MSTGSNIPAIDAAIGEIRLHHASGAEVRIIPFGASIRDWLVPLPGGGRQRVVLGLENIADYPQHAPHMGAIAGRFANRIGNGRFVLDGQPHQLPCNQGGKHSLHGGGEGFGRRNWQVLHADGASVVLALHSPDGDAGYPGAMTATCRYTLDPKGTLRLDLTAFSDRPTVINLATHSYFNLDGSPDVLDHELTVRANVMTPVDTDLIPIGTLAAVSGTPFDFRVPRPIRFPGADGTRFAYDNNFMLRRERCETGPDGMEIAHAATLRSPKNGLSMEVWTSEPCLQVYDGAKMKVGAPGLGGTVYGASAGLCLEPQHVPDSPNLPHFPSTVLRPGQLYRQITEYRF